MSVYSLGCSPPEVPMLFALLAVLAQAVPTAQPIESVGLASGDAPGLARGDARAPIDDPPTAFACTLEKIVRGDRCTYEGGAKVPPPAPGSPLGPGQAQRAGNSDQASQNSELAASAARGCATVPAGPVRKSCERDIAEASLAPGCTLGGEAPLADAGGRLVPAARHCVTKLRAALQLAQKMASVSHACCRCLAQARCSVNELQCNRELSELSASVQLSACIARACAEQCTFFSAPGAPSPEVPDKI